MERQCHHCSAAVPEGTPFCAACGAPQIRVVAPQTTSVPSNPEDSTRPSLVPSTMALADTPSAIRWGAAFKNCLIAAAAITLVMFLARHPVLILLTLPAGGWLAVYLYARRLEHLPVTTGIGARIGAVTGLVAFGVYALVMGLVLVFQRSQVMESLKKTLTAAAAQNPDPQAQRIVEKLMTPEGIAVLVTISAIFLFFVFLVLCSVGGAIGGSMAKSKRAV